MNLLIIRTIASIHLYLITVFAVYLLLRGHNSPGGGFIAGLLTALAIVLQAVAFDTNYAQKLLPIKETWLIGGGLLLALGTGVLPVVMGRAFLDHTFRHFSVPLLGNVELASAVLFDLGVYLVIVGVTKWVILTIAGEVGEPNSGLRREKSKERS